MTTSIVPASVVASAVSECLVLNTEKYFKELERHANSDVRTGFKVCCTLFRTRNSSVLSTTLEFESLTSLILWFILFFEYSPL